MLALFGLGALGFRRELQHWRTQINPDVIKNSSMLILSEVRPRVPLVARDVSAGQWVQRRKVFGCARTFAIVISTSRRPVIGKHLTSHLIS